MLGQEEFVEERVHLEEAIAREGDAVSLVVEHPAPAQALEGRAEA